jgi:catechol 2,3-dioxygenase-like lactoylglutathione lyase family enzyme
MRVNALDHVNIITADLDAPPPLTPANAQWMYDAAGRAIIHVNSLDCPRTYQREVSPGPTGALHHVALNCSGYEQVLARLASAGRKYQLNLVAAIGLRQVFTLDPNGILLELNFFAD